MKKETLVLDDMFEKAHKSIHTVSFTFVALIVGVALFVISQTIFIVFVVDDEESAEMFLGTEAESVVTMDKVLGHDYCGTFYIWLTVGNNYKSVEDYNKIILFC